MQAIQDLQTFDQLVQRAILARLFHPTDQGVIEDILVSRQSDQAIWAQLNRFFHHLSVRLNESAEQTSNLALQEQPADGRTTKPNEDEHSVSKSSATDVSHAGGADRSRKMPTVITQPQPVKHNKVLPKASGLKPAPAAAGCVSLFELDHPVHVVGTNVTKATYALEG